ncbi:MAG: hypothetical protein ACTTKA_06185 [Tannerella sp.]
MFVIPNAVRNLAPNAFGVRPSASGGEPTEQRAGRKKIRLSEAHEALTFWLLLGQAKSNGKEIHRFALNDKIGENYKLRMTNAD